MQGTYGMYVMSFLPIHYTDIRIGTTEQLELRAACEVGLESDSINIYFSE